MTDLPPPPPQQPWGAPGAPGTGPPPPPGGAGPYGGPPPYGGQPPYGTPGYGPPSGGSSTNGLAIASLITALAGIPVMLFCLLGWIPWIVAIVLGLVALSQIKGSEGRQGGRGLAIGGVAVSAACIALTIIGTILVIFVFAEAVDEICDEDRDGDGFNECIDDDDFDPTVGNEPFEGFDTSTTFSIPQ